MKRSVVDGVGGEVVHEAVQNPLLKPSVSVKALGYKLSQALGIPSVLLAKSIYLEMSRVIEISWEAPRPLRFSDNSRRGLEAIGENCKQHSQRVLHSEKRRSNFRVMNSLSGKASVQHGDCVFIADIPYEDLANFLLQLQSSCRDFLFVEKNLPHTRLYIKILADHKFRHPVVARSKRKQRALMFLKNLPIGGRNVIGRQCI